MRIFKNENQYGEESYLFLTDSEIQKKYNCYHLYFIDENFKYNLNKYRKERNEAFEEYKKETEVSNLQEAKDFLIEFQKDYEVKVDNFSDYYGRPTLFVLCEDEDFLTSIDNFYWYPDKNQAIEKDYDNYIEYFTYWDGSNHKEIYLRDNLTMTDWDHKEVTDEFEDLDWENKVHFSGHRDDNVSWSEYYLAGGYIWRLDTSLYANHLDSWGLVCKFDKDEINDEGSAALLKSGEMELIEKYILSENRKHLKEGEEICYDDGAVCLLKDGEDYHFSNEEIIQVDQDFVSSVAFEIPFDLARNQIQKRVIEKDLDEYAKDNYAKVDTLPLTNIFVGFSDSIDAGNCEENTQKTKKMIGLKEGIAGDFATRADVLLGYRDDSYSRRAVLCAYRKRYS